MVRFGILARILCLIGMLILPALALADDPVPPEETPGIASGEGVEFTVISGDSINLTVTTSELVRASIEAPTRTTVYLTLEGVEAAAETQVTIAGLPAGLALHRATDDLRNDEILAVDENGIASFTIDLSAGPHYVMIRAYTSTWYLGAAGWTPRPGMELPGTWDPATKTAVLTKDVNETVQIDGGDIIFDGNGHRIAPTNGNALYLNYASRITVKNLQVVAANDGHGISVFRGSGDIVRDCAITATAMAGIHWNASSDGHIIGNAITQGSASYAGIKSIFASGRPALEVTGNTIHAPRALWLEYPAAFDAYNNNFYCSVAPYVSSPAGMRFNLCLPTGGNYWSPYTGIDANGDRFGDTRFLYGSRVQDNLPYVSPDGWLQPFTPADDPDSLLAIYSFEGNVQDLSPSALHAVAVNNVAFAAGYEGQAGDFNGASSWADLPIDLGAMNHPRITFGAWVKTRATTGRRAILSHENGGYDRQIGLDDRWGTQAGWSAQAGVGDQGVNSGIVSTADWTFVAVTYDECSTTLYVNDQLFTTTESTGGGTALARIGKSPVGNAYFNGLVDNLFVFHGALNATQIAAIRAGGLNEIMRWITVDIAGTVTSDCGGPLAGIPVTLDYTNFDGLPESQTAVTTEDGRYAFVDIPRSSTGQLAIELPGLLRPIEPATTELSIPLTADRVADFLVACPKTVSGVVSADVPGVLPGVTVGLIEPESGYQSMVTGADGAFSFADIPYGTEVELFAAAPLGFVPVDPVDGHCLLTVTSDMTKNLLYNATPATGSAQGMGYWKHQVSVYRSNKGRAQETRENMESVFPQAIFHHFNENELNAIQVEGVTYRMVNGAPEPLTLVEMEATLSVKGGRNMLERAKQHYLPLLLNVASGKVPTYMEISADHLTASQALQFVADLILDGDDSNDELAKDVCETINEGHTVAAGVIVTNRIYIAYKEPPKPIPFRVVPNPGIGPRAFQFQLASPSHVDLVLLDVTGREVKTLFAGEAEAGVQEIRWNGDVQGASSASGVYFARLRMGSETQILKVMQVGN